MPRRRFFGARFVYYLAFFTILFVVLFGSYRNQFGELFAPFESNARKLPAVVYTGANSSGAPAGPSVVKPGANSISAPAGPRVIELDGYSTDVFDKTNLPTVVRPGTNPPGAPADSSVDKSGNPPSRPPGGMVHANGIAVVDGDTISVYGQKYRLIGIDTPESGVRAKCDAERELAARAARRLREIVTRGDVKFERVACTCPAGTEGTPACNYGRLCAVLTAAGRDVGTMLIGEGLAHSYVCVSSHCPARWRWC